MASNLIAMDRGTVTKVPTLEAPLLARPGEATSVEDGHVRYRKSTHVGREQFQLEGNQSCP